MRTWPPLGLRVVDPDTYLAELHDTHPAEVQSTIIELARTKTRPPTSTDDILAALERAGLSELPRRLRSS